MKTEIKRSDNYWIGNKNGTIEIASLCDLCGYFAHFAVKERSFLQFSKTEPILSIIIKNISVLFIVYGKPTYYIKNNLVLFPKKCGVINPPDLLKWEISYGFFQQVMNFLF